MARHPARNVHVIVGTSIGMVLLVAATLSWLALQLLARDEEAARQQARDRLERTAETLVTAFLRRLEDADARLTEVGSSIPAGSPGADGDGVLVLLKPSGVETSPPDVLPWVPLVQVADSFDARFEAADRLEVQGRREDLPQLQRMLLALATDPDRAVRAEASLRLARVQKRVGDVPTGLTMLSRLRAEAVAGPTGVPYGLTSRIMRIEWLSESGDGRTARYEAGTTLSDLHTGRFVVQRDAYEYYEEKLRGYAGGDGPRADPAAMALASVVEQLWAEWQDFVASGSPSRRKRLHETSPTPVLAILNATPERMAAFVYVGNAVQTLGTGRASESMPAGYRVRLSFEAPSSALSSGRAGAQSPSITRSLNTAALPWHLTLTDGTGSAPEGPLAQRRLYFALTLGGVLLLVCGACYALARGVLREADAARRQSDFVSAVSHEFRSPLTTLRQLTELLAHGRIADERRRRQYFEVLQKETLRLHQLVEDLLDFGRMDAGRRQYRLEPVDLHELVRQGIAAYETESSTNGHRIEFNADSGALVIDADREAMGRVVRNLIENAVKYSPDRECVWVEARAEDHGVVLRVRDEGIGIPPEERRRIFDKFVRGEGAKQACIPGTGIGLAMVKEIVQVHRGRLDVHSELGRGSTFEVRLPLRETQGAAG